MALMYLLKFCESPARRGCRNAHSCDCYRGYSGQDSKKQAAIARSHAPGSWASITRGSHCYGNGPTYAYSYENRRRESGEKGTEASSRNARSQVFGGPRSSLPPAYAREGPVNPASAKRKLYFPHSIPQISATTKKAQIFNSFDHKISQSRYPIEICEYDELPQCLSYFSGLSVKRAYEKVISCAEKRATC